MSRVATARLKVNPPLGSLPVLQYCPPDHLKIDPVYQRSLDTGGSQALIKRIAQFWNWDLCQPLVVSRREDGCLYVVDGQHRLAAAQLRGDIGQLPCVVTAYATAADEAASFVHLNQQRRPLSALDLFKAAIASEDPEALDIQRRVADAGLRLAPHMTAAGWKPGMIGNVGGLQRVSRQYGSARLGVALKALAHAFAGQVLRYAGTIFPGIAAVAGEKGAALDFDRLVGVLRSRSQVEWRSEIALHHAANPTVGMMESAKAVLRKAYDETSASEIAQPEPSERLPPAMMLWCDQCDRRVSGAQVNRCTSQFCKAHALEAEAA